MTCPKPETLAIDVQRPGEIGLTLGSASPRLLDGTSTGGRLFTEFSDTTGSTEKPIPVGLANWSGIASRGRSRGGPVWDRAPTWR